MRTLSWFSLALLMAVAILSLGSLQAGSFVPFTGLAERLFVAAMLTWMVVASLQLYRLAGRRAP